MKEIAIRKDVIKKDVFYETEKASERMEDMHLFIQTALENRNFFTVGSWNRQILFRQEGDNLTVLELVKKYIGQKTGVRHNTEANYNFVINIIKKEEFGAKRIDKVKLSDAKAWLIKLQADGRGYSTIHSVRGVVRPAFQMAVDDDLIRKNPFEFQLCTVVVNDSVTREAITRKQESSWNLLRMMSIINDTMMVCLSSLKPDFVFQSSAD